MNLVPLVLLIVTLLAACATLGTTTPGTAAESKDMRLVGHESFTSIYYRKLVFLAYFNAGVRAVDIRNPFAPRDVAHFIPAVTAATARRCIIELTGAAKAIVE